MNATPGAADLAAAQATIDTAAGAGNPSATSADQAAAMTAPASGSAASSVAPTSGPNTPSTMEEAQARGEPLVLRPYEAKRPPASPT